MRASFLHTVYYVHIVFFWFLRYDGFSNLPVSAMQTLARATTKTSAVTFILIPVQIILQKKTFSSFVGQKCCNTTVWAPNGWKTVIVCLTFGPWLEPFQLICWTESYFIELGCLRPGAIRTDLQTLTGCPGMSQELFCPGQACDSPEGYTNYLTEPRLHLPW